MHQDIESYTILDSPVDTFDLLDALMNASMSFGKGKSGEGEEFSLPDIIKKLGEMKGEVEQGMKPGEEQGKQGEDGKEGSEGKEGREGKEGEGENSEQMNSEIYEIYKQQAMLREALKKALGDAPNGDKKGKKSGSGDAVKKMEELEDLLLEKGFSQDLVEKIKRLQYELLKLEEAKLEQGEDVKRKSKSNVDLFEKGNIDKLKLKNKYFNQNELLNRQSLPLRKIYKKKIQEYYKSIPVQ